MNGLKNLRNLQTLHIGNCGVLTNIECLKELNSLHELHLEFSKASANVAVLRKMKNLHSLDLRGHGGVRRGDLDSLRQNLPGIEVMAQEE